MKRRIHLIVFALLFSHALFLSGCSTTGKSVGTGAAAGGVLGAGVGALADPGEGGHNRFRNVVIGIAAGSIVGAGTGFILDRNGKDDRDDAYARGNKDGKKEIETQANMSGMSSPRLLPAKTEAKWVPDQVRGNVFVPAHFEYFISESARWSP